MSHRTNAQYGIFSIWAPFYIQGNFYETSTLYGYSSLSMYLLFFSGGFGTKRFDLVHMEGLSGGSGKFLYRIWWNRKDYIGATA